MSTDSTGIDAWGVSIREIGSDGLGFERSASDAERLALAKRLGVLACDHLSVVILVKPLAKGRFLVRGWVKASIVQGCVISLEPVQEVVDEAIDLEFWPEEQVQTPGETEREVLGVDDPEAIHEGRIEIGRIGFEIVAAGLESYPRLADVELHKTASPAESDAEASGPFAVLADWKKKDS